MSIDINDEILQDFLVEAGEILEELNEQLLDLEQRPEDLDLLNAAFRGFHTIKGGAGFLGIDPLVEVCHRAEDVFNVLRQGNRKVDAGLMDTMLRVLDIVNEMFESIKIGETPADAEPALLKMLTQLTLSESEKAEVEAEPDQKQSVDKQAAQETGTTTEAKSGSDTAPKPEPGSDDITDEEFDALLDELHGPGKHGGIPNSGNTKPQGVAAEEEISEEEFEKLLDQLHGPGRHGGVPGQGSVNQKPAADTNPDQPQVSTEAPVPEITKKPTAPAAGSNDQTTPPPASPVEGRDNGRPSKKGDTTVRVDTSRLDEIMNMVGELVLVRNRLSTLKSRLGDDEVATVVANLDLVTADLQNAVMKTRMQPVKKVFGRFPRVVRDLARNLNKQIDLQMFGEDTDLDKNLVEALSDPMIHLVRNAVDHGIETPEERKKAGKSEQGKVVLSAAQEGDHILLSIADDGRGMEAETLRQKAVEKGMMDQETAARLDEKDCYNLIFQPGFSTKAQISDVSGRGVGMDVVKTRIAQMNGSVEIDSELGVGSTITIKLPLTLAILPTLMVVLGSQSFALPLSSVVEIFNLDLSRTHTVDGQLSILVRERALPLFYLREWLVNRCGEREQGEGQVVVVNVGGKQVCLVVDHLVGQEEVVIKPLGALLQGLDGMAGATITGDGKIALILDVPGLMRKYVRRR